MSETTDPKLEQLRKDFEAFKKLIVETSETWADSGEVKDLKRRVEALEKNKRAITPS